MLHRSMLAAIALTCTLGAAPAQELAKFPDWKGMWVRIGAGGQYDPTKPAARGQQPPLKPEYQALWEARILEGRRGGQYYNTQVRCLPGGMPRMMMAYEPMEMIILPETTYVHITFNNEFRRIYTDGRDWPEFVEPSFSGYSIGRWLDEDGDGRYDTLEVETRFLKGPRIFDPTGIPMADDNETIVKERIFVDKADSNILRDELTTTDNALTRPWTVTRSYRRDKDRTRKPVWVEHICEENNEYIFIEQETYYIGPDGKLAPSRAGQAPPDLRHFQQADR
jgi:hypothetical protein